MALRAASNDTQDPVERMVRLGLVYIDFAQEHPTDFMLLFGRRSTRRSLAEDVPTDSEYVIIRAAVADPVGVRNPGSVDPRILEVLAYGFWSSIHGMAALRLTHLAGFGADFATAHRLRLEGTARSWQRADWTRVGPPATACGYEPGGE